MAYFPRRSLWWSEAVLLAGLLAYTALVYAGAAALSRSPQGGGVVWQALIAVVPGLLWLAFFFLQDRVEPEPKPYVLGLFGLGALLGYAVVWPVQRWFAVSDWLFESPWVTLLGSVLVVGALQEFVKYAAVRYTVYGSQEFSEPVDGVVYATAAGLGLATFLNLHYVLEHGGVDLRVGILRITVTALAQASLAGLLGYCMGRAKFRPGGDTWPLVGGLVGVALLNGLFTYASAEVASQGLEFRPGNSLLLAALLAGAVGVALFVLIRRTPQRPEGALAAEARRYYLAEDLPVLAVVLLMLAGGWALRGAVQNATVPVQVGVWQAQVPARWLQRTDNQQVELQNLRSGSTFLTTLSLSWQPAGGRDANQAALQSSLQYAARLPFYRHLRTGARVVAGQGEASPATTIEYVYVTDPSSLLLGEPLPVVVRVEEVFLVRSGGLLRVRLAAEAGQFAREGQRLERVLASLHTENGR